MEASENRPWRLDTLGGQVMDDRIDDSQVKTRFILSDPRGVAHVKIKSGGQ